MKSDSAKVVISDSDRTVTASVNTGMHQLEVSVEKGSNSGMSAEADGYRLTCKDNDGTTEVIFDQP